MRWLIALLALGVVAAPVRADRVYLASGNVIEGKAERHDDKVVVEVEAGEITLPSESVIRIEASESSVQVFEKRYAKLQVGDVKALLSLADFCRDHGMREHERELLQKVIEHAPDHAEARARLGFVHTDAGWITREDQLREQGMVQYEGRWVTREQMLELERLKSQAETAQRERDKAQVELQRQQLELEQARAEAERAKAEASEQPANSEPVATVFTQTYPLYPVWTDPSPEYDCVAGLGAHRRARCRRTTRAVHHHVPFPIVGAKDPFDFLSGSR